MNRLKQIHKRAVFLSLFLFGSIASFAQDGEEQHLSEKPIVVVVASYNNAEYYEKNLDSIFSQNYTNYRVVYLDDSSPDGTGPLVEDYLQKNGETNRTTLFQNKKRVGAGANYYKGVWACKPYEIVACLDGDDWFAHENVLKKLNSVYSNPNVWVTYGQFAYHPCGTIGWAAQVPDDVIAKNGFRDRAWVTTALRTFYAGLYHKIKKNDLLYNGDFFPMAQDLAYMWPILEMAGTHSRFIPEILYIYNIETPINDVKIDRKFQQKLGLHIRTRKRYQPVKSPY
ncbi:MAG: putative glycosyltransferase EpsH [Chlamydiae bacterium]|nr:putative glycosyltransferase EpsH [Chlamydiota bacterium]